MKTCTKCGLGKTEAEFTKDRTKKDGLECSCKLCKQEYRRQRYIENTEVILARNAEYIKRAPVEVVEKQKARRRVVALATYRLDLEVSRAKARKYRSENKHIWREAQTRRRLKDVLATPVWASERYISLFYTLAKEEQALLGRRVDVDHIVPVNSPYVCGLHCEDNLQLLFKEDNIRKGNRHWPDMWEPL